jgi:hypothetical protein
MWLAQQPAMRSQIVLMFPSELPARMSNIILFLALWTGWSTHGVVFNTTALEMPD